MHTVKSLSVIMKMAQPSELELTQLCADAEESPPTKVYLGRYYILLVFSLFVIQQTMAWMTFAMVPVESYQTFRLSSEQIILMEGEAMNV